MSSTKFTFYKISVELTENLSLFREDKPKNQVVIDAFTAEEPIIFSHQGAVLAYVQHKTVGDYIIASLGKQSETELSGPPSTGFESVTQEEWPHVLVVINTGSTQPLGQTVAIMKDGNVFKAPLNALRSLVDHIAATSSLLEGYELIPNSISTKESFWDIIRSKTGRIQRLTFDLAAPNFLGLNDEISESMKGLKNTYNATKATVAIENPEGSLHVPREDPFVQQAVNYATQGAGDIKLKVQSEGTINAKKNIVTASISTIDTKVVVESENPETVKSICDTLFSCLNHLD